jgi:hypothetical protein
MGGVKDSMIRNFSQTGAWSPISVLQCFTPLGRVDVGMGLWRLCAFGDLCLIRCLLFKVIQSLMPNYYDMLQGLRVWLFLPDVT